MSNMTLRLDTAGLRSLIEENQDFKIEIQQSVMNNIRQDNIEHAVRERINTVLKTMCVRKDNNSWYNPKLKVNDQYLLDAIRETVVQEVKEQASRVIQDTVHDVLIAERARFTKDMNVAVKDAMLLALTPEMAKEILLTKLI